ACGVEDELLGNDGVVFDALSAGHGLVMAFEAPRGGERLGFVRSQSSRAEADCQAENRGAARTRGSTSLGVSWPHTLHLVMNARRSSASFFAAAGLL